MLYVVVFGASAIRALLLKSMSVRELMAARRAVRDATDPRDRIAARLKVDAAKKALGERGHVWWDDGAPDYNRHLAVRTPYAAWFNQSSD